MAEPALCRAPVDTVQQLLRDAEEAWNRAREGIQVGTDPIIIAQDLRSAGESLCLAGDELALRARAAGKAARRATP